jgi:hypothetical protein
MSPTEAIAERFRKLNFHDDTLVSMNILPAQTRDDVLSSVIEIVLANNNERRTIQFTGCANLRVGLDFDVLANNLAPNTSDVDAHSKASLMRELMESQKTLWNVDYGSTISPLDHKLEALGECANFRVQFFGGVVEIIARDFRVQEVGK